MKMPKCARKTLFLHLKRMNMMKVQIINRGHQPLPAYATPQSAGMDLRANIDESIVLHLVSKLFLITASYPLPHRKVSLYDHL